MQKNLEAVKLELLNSEEENYFKAIEAEDLKNFIKSLREAILEQSKTKSAKSVIAFCYRTKNIDKKPDENVFSLLALAEAEKFLGGFSNQDLKKDILPQMVKQIKEQEGVDPEFFIIVSDVIIAKMKEKTDVEEAKKIISEKGDALGTLKNLKNSETGLLIHIEHKDFIFLEAYAKFYLDEDYNSSTEFVMSPKPVTSFFKLREEIPEGNLYWKF